MNTDLNISNYELKDILNLFDIQTDFTESDLKNAKMVVLKTHPDKSGLNPDYFRFYSKAYKMLYSVWEFRKKGDINKIKNTDYISTDDTKKVLLDEFFNSNEQLKHKGKFNKWFNEQFDKNKIINEGDEKGYENWFRSDSNLEPEVTKITMATMGEEFEKRKVKARSLSLIVHQEVQELSSNNNNSLSSSELSSDAPSCFDSGLFSNLGFQDLHKAYTETVLPVNQEDFENKAKFKNVNDYVKFRGSQDNKPLSEQQSLAYLNNREKNANETATKTAYDLAKQSELAQHKNKEFWANIQRIH